VGDTPLGRLTPRGDAASDRAGNDQDRIGLALGNDAIDFGVSLAE